MNKRTRAKRNLIVAVVMILIGLGILYVSNMLYGFRLDVGYETMPNSCITGLFSMFICLAEMTIGMAGIALAALGVASCL